jgi:hypothetical protein
MLADGYYELSDELDVEGYRCQVVREWRGTSERLYYARIPGGIRSVGWTDRE